MQNAKIKASLDGLLIGDEFAAASPDRVRTAATLTDLAEPNLRQVTVVFADIVDSTELIGRIGDRKWMELLNAYYGIVNRQLNTFNGWHLSVAGDGILAAFDSSADALRCAVAILDGVRDLGLSIRIGVHAGECLVMGKIIAGLALHIGARIAARAGPNQVFVSASAKNQLSEPDIRFIEVGTHNLKGLPGMWSLFLAVW